MRAGSIARRLIAFVFAAVLSTVVLAAPAWAEAGDGSGGGGGADVPFAIQSSYPANGATGVSQNPGDLWIRFTHNVADPAVSDHNASLVSLVAEDGSVVSATAWCYDAQIDFDQRQYIYITPLEQLKSQTTYSIVASTGIMARNGIHQTTSTERVTFVTGGSVSAEEPSSGTPESSIAPEEAVLPVDPSASSDDALGGEESTSPGAEDASKDDSDASGEAGKEDPSQAGAAENDGAEKKDDSADSESERSWMHSGIWWVAGGVILLIAVALALAAVWMRRTSKCSPSEEGGGSGGETLGGEGSSEESALSGSGETDD